MRKTFVAALVMTALTTGAAALELHPAGGGPLPGDGQTAAKPGDRLSKTEALSPYELPLAHALDLPELPHDLNLRSGVLHFTGDPGASETVVLVEVPLDDMGTRVEPATGAWRAHISMLALVRDDEKRVLSRLSHDRPLRGTDPSTGLRGRSVVLKRTLRLPPGRYVLEAAVRDRESGRIGARRVSFEVPETSPDLSLGSVAVVRFQPAPPGPRDPFDPLLINGVSALPILGAPVAVESGPVGLLASLHPGREAGPVSVTVEFRRAGEVLAQASPEIPKPDPDGRITLAHTFALPSIEPGPYEVHVRVRQGREVVTATTSYRLAPATPVGMLSPDVARPGAWH